MDRVVERAVAAQDLVASDGHCDARRQGEDEPVRRGALPACEIAGRIAEALSRDDGSGAWRWLMQFVDDYRGSSPAGRSLLVRTPPPPTGDRGYDAALAALVEHLCASNGAPAPGWTDEPERFAEPWWFVAALPALRAAALRDSPISFKRHGVFLTSRALSRV